MGDGNETGGIVSVEIGEGNETGGTVSLEIGDGNETGGTELVVVPGGKSTERDGAPDVVSRRLMAKVEPITIQVEKARIFDNCIALNRNYWERY